MVVTGLIRTPVTRSFKEVQPPWCLQVWVILVKKRLFLPLPVDVIKTVPIGHRERGERSPPATPVAHRRP